MVKFNLMCDRDINTFYVLLGLRRWHFSTPSLNWGPELEVNAVCFAWWVLPMDNVSFVYYRNGFSYFFLLLFPFYLRNYVYVQWTAHQAIHFNSNIASIATWQDLPMFSLLSWKWNSFIVLKNYTRFFTPNCLRSDGNSPKTGICWGLWRICAHQWHTTV